MKHPKLKQTVLCQALLYAPFVIFSVGGLALGILLCEVLPTWLFVMVLFSGLLLGLAYLIFLRFLFTDFSDLLFDIRNWYSLRTEYVTDKNGSSRGAVKDTIFRRCRRWGIEVSQVQHPECTLFYRNVRSLGISTAPHPYRVGNAAGSKELPPVHPHCPAGTPHGSGANSAKVLPAREQCRRSCGHHSGRHHHAGLPRTSLSQFRS